LQIEIGIARSLMAGLGGRFPDVQGRAVSLDELMSSEIGTRVTEEVVGGVTRRTLKENGELLGVIERDEDQVIRVTLAGGRIVNQPFESIEEAQEWMLGRYSKNQLFTRDPEADEDTGFAFGGNP
jgi:predicted NUDIX family phosphoesterase